MRRIAAMLLAVAALASAGCQMCDMFGLIGSYHSSAYDREERYHNYRSEIERWEGYKLESAAR